MRENFANTSGLMYEIAKGWKPNYYLSNMAMAHFQQQDMYVAPSVFPMCPVQQSTGLYYVFNKEEIAKDQVGKKPKYGRVAPAVFSHSEEKYSCEVDQIILGIDNISALNYQRSGAPATIDPRRAKVRLATEQMKLHLDMVFARNFFNEAAWENVKTGDATGSGNNQFVYFDDANMDIVGYFDDLKRDILLAGRRMPNKLSLGYDAFKAMKNHPQFLERVTGSGSTPNPAKVNERVIAEVLGIPEVKVLYSTANNAALGKKADMQFICDTNAALLCYAPDTPSIEEPSAGYIFVWDMLGNGQWMATSQFDGEGGTHAEFIEGLMATQMAKTCDDLAVYLSGCTAPKADAEAGV